MPVAHNRVGVRNPSNGDTFTVLTVFPSQKEAAREALAAVRQHDGLPNSHMLHIAFVSSTAPKVQVGQPYKERPRIDGRSFVMPMPA